MGTTLNRTAEGIELRSGSLRAVVNDRRIIFAHLGCMLLGKLRKRKEPLLPEALEETWDSKLGKTWRDEKDATNRVSRALAESVGGTDLSGVDLWDTMRKGSDYWRPGNLLRKVAEDLRLGKLEVSYFREDDIAPPADLLERFMAEGSQNMNYGEFANEYARHLRDGGGLNLAAGGVVTALARRRLAVFYCTDPYIPGYADKSQLGTAIPYASRTWLTVPELRSDGCHRVILAEETAKFFLQLGSPVRILEIDPTFTTFHARDLAPRGPEQK